MFEITLKSGKDKPVRMGHPWIFTGAIAKLSEKAESGSLCKIRSSHGEILGIGYYNQHSAIAIRVLSLGEKSFDADTLKIRMQQAIESRKNLLDTSTNSCRLINSEGDFLPGLIVDRYCDGLVVQILTAGIELFRHPIIENLVTICKPAFIYERSDTESRKREGLQESEGLLYGKVDSNIIVKENDACFAVDVGSGQKTGFYFDQRQNRQLIRTYAAARRMCDCFSYSGAFTVNSLKANVASVDCVDISKNAIEWTKKNIALNGFGMENVSTFNADVFKYLRETDKRYDLIVLDPPKFAKHQGEVERAARGYKDINLVAMKKIEENGILFTFSCSNAVDIKLFRQIVFSAAADSGRLVQVLHVLSSGPDHPVNIAHKEGDYLKGLVLRIL